MMFIQPQNISTLITLSLQWQKFCNMKKYYPLFFFLLIAFSSFSQQTFTGYNSFAKFDIAKEYFQKEQYSH